MNVFSKLRVPSNGALTTWGFLVSAALTAGLSLFGCGGGGGDGAGGSGGAGGTGGAPGCGPDIASIEATIFKPSCALSGCHSGANPAADLDLSGDTEPILVGVLSATCQGSVRVVPGDPAASLLFQKVDGVQTCGGAMPPAGALPADQRACLEDWIASLPSMGTGGSGGGNPCEMCGGDTCVELQTDAQNCGSCGNACPSGASCIGGSCACPVGTSDCNGTCMNTSTDPTNCGACGNVCPAGASCSNGACDCAGGGSSCNGMCVDLMTSATNCGACNVVCGSGESCVAGVCTCAGSSVSFSGAVQPIFSDNCVGTGCHGGFAPAQSMSLEPGKAYSALVNVTAGQCFDGRKRVLPGSASQSYLMDKVMGVDLCFGTKMPKLGMISQADIQTLSDWICTGAPNN